MKHNAITAFSTVDPDNVHVAIAANIAAELWHRYPNIHFQALGPARGIKIPGQTDALTQAAVTFTFYKYVYRDNKRQSLYHVGTIRIDNGVCILLVTDPALSTYTQKVYLLDESWPLEFPGFPQVLYDTLAPVLVDAEGPSRDRGETLIYLYEVRKKSTPADAHTPLRHLAERIDIDPIKTLCGLKIDRADVREIRHSENFTRDGIYCCNCRESKLFKLRRGE